MFYVAAKSGTNGHFSHDGCDMIIREIESTNIPNVDDILEFGDDDNRNKKQYVVREVARVYNHANENHKFAEYIYVYVIKV